MKSKKIYELFPELGMSNNMDMEEMNFIKGCIKDMDDETMETFAKIYRAQRRDPQTMLIVCLVGFLVIPGLQRFYINQIALGLLYLFTIGLCFIGSIIDLINHKKLALEYNMNVAHNIMRMLSSD